MNRDEQKGTWVLLVVLATLFVFSVASPHRWQAFMDQQPTTQRLVMRPHEYSKRPSKLPSSLQSTLIAARPGKTTRDFEQQQSLHTLSHAEVPEAADALPSAPADMPPATAVPSRSDRPAIATGPLAANSANAASQGPYKGSCPTAAWWGDVLQTEPAPPDSWWSWTSRPQTMCGTTARDPQPPAVSFENGMMRASNGDGRADLCWQPSLAAPTSSFRPVDPEACRWIVAAPRSVPTFATEVGDPHVSHTAVAPPHGVPPAVPQADLPGEDVSLAEGQTEAAQAAPTSGNSLHPGLVQPAASQPQTPEPDTAPADTAAEPATAEAAAVEAASVEDASGDAVSGDAVSGDAVSGDAVSGDGAPVEAAHSETAQAQAAPVDTVAVDATSVQTPTLDPLSAEAVRAEAAPAESVSRDVTGVDAVSTETLLADGPRADVAPAEPAPVKAPSGEAAPADSIPAEAAPVEAGPVEASSGESAPGESAPAESVPSEAAHSETAQAQAAPVDTVAVDATPAQTPTLDDVSADAVPADAVSAGDVPADAVRADAVPADAVPADDVPADDVPAEGVPTKAAPAEAVPADTTPADTEKADTFQPILPEGGTGQAPAAQLEAGPETSDSDLPQAQVFGEASASCKGPWCLPPHLEAHLDALAVDCTYSQWANRVLHLVQELAELADRQPARALEILAELRQLTDEQHPALLQARAASSWRPSAAVGVNVADTVLRVAAALRRLVAAWELIAPLPASAAGLASRRAAAKHLADSLVAQQELDRWRAARDRWGQAILAFETERLPSQARTVVSETLALANEPWVARDLLDEHVSTYYRGANIRLAVHARLLNRFVPAQPTIELPVNERVLGLPTRGWSTTNTAVRVRLVPDRECVRLHLEAEGMVASRTTSSAGLATLFNASQSPFLARKEIVIAPQGLFIQPSNVEADSSTRLRQVQTEFDGVPLIAQVIKGVVRSRHEQSRARLRAEGRRKVVARVSEQLDSTANERINALAARIQTRLLVPLAGLDLPAEVVELSTTAERATARVRVASPLQLAAHTPRPLAPSHSLVSLQMHESALNNVVERLELEGQSYTVPELQAFVCQRLQLPADALSTAYSDDLRVTFAPRDAVHVHFDQGKVKLQLNLAEIRTPAKTWRDVSATVFFRPQCDRLHAQLIRDGAVQLTGPRLRGRMLIALRGVFCKVFPSERPVELMPERLLQDPRLADLEVAQLVFQDGWMGIALAPSLPPASARWYFRRRYTR